MLTDDLMPIAEKSQRSSAQDIAGMKRMEAEHKWYNATRDVRGLKAARP